MTPVLTLGPLNVTYFGLLVFAGALCGVLLSLRKKEIGPVLPCVILGALLIGHMWWVFFCPPGYSAEIGSAELMLRIWEGGYTLYGALFGGLLGAVIGSKLAGLQLTDGADALSVDRDIAAPLRQQHADRVVRLPFDPVHPLCRLLRAKDPCQRFLAIRLEHAQIAENEAIRIVAELRRVRESVPGKCVSGRDRIVVLRELIRDLLQQRQRVVAIEPAHVIAHLRIPPVQIIVVLLRAAVVEQNAVVCQRIALQKRILHAQRLVHLCRRQRLPGIPAAAQQQRQDQRRGANASLHSGFPLLRRPPPPFPAAGTPKGDGFVRSVSPRIG